MMTAERAVLKVQAAARRQLVSGQYRHIQDLKGLIEARQPNPSSFTIACFIRKKYPTLIGVDYLKQLHRALDDFSYQDPEFMRWLRATALGYFAAKLVDFKASANAVFCEQVNEKRTASMLEEHGKEFLRQLKMVFPTLPDEEVLPNGWCKAALQLSATQADSKVKTDMVGSCIGNNVVDWLVHLTHSVACSSRGNAPRPVQVPAPFSWQISDTEYRVVRVAQVADPKACWAWQGWSKQPPPKLILVVLPTQMLQQMYRSIACHFGLKHVQQVMKFVDAHAYARSSSVIDVPLSTTLGSLLQHGALEKAELSIQISNGSDFALDVAYACGHDLHFELDLHRRQLKLDNDGLRVSFPAAFMAAEEDQKRHVLFVSKGHGNDTTMGSWTRKEFIEWLESMAAFNVSRQAPQALSDLQRQAVARLLNVNPKEFHDQLVAAATGTRLESPSQQSSTRIDESDFGMQSGARGDSIIPTNLLSLRNPQASRSLGMNVEVNAGSMLADLRTITEVKYVQVPITEYHSVVEHSEVAKVVGGIIGGAVSGAAGCAVGVAGGPEGLVVGGAGGTFAGAAAGKAISEKLTATTKQVTTTTMENRPVHSIPAAGLLIGIPAALGFVVGGFGQVSRWKKGEITGQQCAKGIVSSAARGAMVGATTWGTLTLLKVGFENSTDPTISKVCGLGLTQWSVPILTLSFASCSWQYLSGQMSREECGLKFCQQILTACVGRGIGCGALSLLPVGTAASIGSGILGFVAAMATVVAWSKWVTEPWNGRREALHLAKSALGLSDDEAKDRGQIKKRYKALSLLVHPDKNRNPDATVLMQILNLSKDILYESIQAGENTFSTRLKLLMEKFQKAFEVLLSSSKGAIALPPAEDR